MAFYDSYKNNVVPEKGLGQSNRVPLSVLNGNRPKPQRTKGLTEINQFYTTFEPIEKKFNPSLPFSIFTDNENYAPSVINAESESNITSDALQLDALEASTYDDFFKENFCPTPEVRDNEKSSDEIKIEEADYLSFTFPYKKENFSHLRKLELKYRPQTNYINLQSEITTNMRSILVDWLVEVCQEFEYSSETIHLAVSLTDRFLSCTSVTKNKLQLVGIASLFISAKYEEVEAEDLKRYSWITDNTFTKKHILRMEQLIMHKLNFYVGGPTSLAFAYLCYSMVRTPKKVLYLAQYLCELSLLDIDPFLHYLPSQIGIAAYCLARYFLGYSMWAEELKDTGYSLEDLKPIIESLFGKIRSVSGQSQQTYPSISQKYSHSDFMCVADVTPLDILIMCE